MLSDTFDYFEFVNKISQIWKPENNRQLSLEYGLNKAVLPSLVKLNRSWTDTFETVSNRCDDLELQLNHYKSQDIDKLIEKNSFLSDELKKLKDRLKRYKDDIIELEQKNRLLVDNIEKLSNQNTKKKSFFGV